MQLTYGEALGGIIEFTEIGYTIASQDRLWTVFIFDLWSPEDDIYRYNRLFTTGINQPWVYDVGDDVLFWTTRVEAEEFAERLRAVLKENHDNAVASGDLPPDSELSGVYVMNWGDDARYENLWCGNHDRARRTPKFAGSIAAWVALYEMMSRSAAREVSQED